VCSFGSDERAQARDAERGRTAEAQRTCSDLCRRPRTQVKNRACEHRGHTGRIGAPGVEEMGRDAPSHNPESLESTGCPGNPEKVTSGSFDQQVGRIRSPQVGVPV
jgi:hypothetical protein